VDSRRRGRQSITVRSCGPGGKSLHETINLDFAIVPRLLTRIGSLSASEPKAAIDVARTFDDSLTITMDMNYPTDIPSKMTWNETYESLRVKNV
jgi:hypothetical protein